MIRITIQFARYDTHKIRLCLRHKHFHRYVMQQKSLVSYNIGLTGHPQFVFAMVNVYRDTTILVWHDTICISCSLYLGIHWCTSASLHPYYISFYTLLESHICQWSNLLLKPIFRLSTLIVTYFNTFGTTEWQILIDIWMFQSTNFNHVNNHNS